MRPAKIRLTKEQMGIAFMCMSAGMRQYKVAHMFGLSEQQFGIFKRKVEREGFAVWD